MSSFGRQFLLLLWKNYKLQIRRKVITILEIIAPLLFAVILLVIRMVASGWSQSDWSEYSPTRIVESSPFYYDSNVLLYTPLNNITTEIVKNVSQEINTSPRLQIEGFNSEDELMYRFKNNVSGVFAGIVFLSDLSDSSQPFDYKIRPRTRYSYWYTGLPYPLFSDSGPNSGYNGPDYEYSGFLQIQYFVNKALADRFQPNVFNNSTFFSQRMPYPPFRSSSMVTVLQYILSLFIVLSFILNVPQMAKNIAYEKERKLREAMKMMGLRTSVYWLSWFVKNLIYLLVVVILYTIICFIDTQNGRVFQRTEPTLFFVFMLMYILSTIAFSFMISTFFKKANAAAFAAGILYFLTYVPFFFLTSRYDTMTRGQKMAACVLHNMGMAFGINTILISESAGVGYNWSNFHQPGQIGDNLSLLDTLGMLILDTVLYMLIAWYVDTVNPGDAGVAQPLWFPFSPRFWCGSKAEDIGYNNLTEEWSGDNFEIDRSGAKEGIRTQHLRKRFGANVAVNDLTLTMYEGQITALLGHNGAGKTTTISMLTGFMKPSGGGVSIYGKDVSCDMDEIRKNIGFCPQHNILFDTLTVEEHLIFFAKLKGCPSNNIDQEVNEMIKSFGLEQKRHALSSTLSGGQKRKLSVGIALVAGSKVVILDEPTSGLDPAARRGMWDVLQRYRAARTIILTTHFMDEADILGDRIAIMAYGKLQCCGTSMFLKKLYGAGYHLVIVKDTDCNVDQLTSIIQSFIPTAHVETHISSEISYLLPFSEADKFENLFNELERTMADIHIRSFGISATTMEEVFLRVGEGALKDEKSNSKNDKRLSEASGDDYNSINDPDSITLNNMDNQHYIGFNQGFGKYNGIGLVLQQCYAIFIKKIIHSVRHLAISIAQLILPVVFAIIALSIIIASENVDSDSQSLKFDLSLFPDYIVAYSSSASVPTKLTDMYISQFSGKVKPVDRTVYNSTDSFFKHEITTLGLPTFQKEYIIGGEFKENRDGLQVIAHYNGLPYHAEPIALQYAMNGVLKYVTNDPSKHINVRNHPLPAISDRQSNQESASFFDMFVAILVVFGMAFMTATFSLFYIKERSIGAKHLQVVSGVGPVSYWMTSFVWDLLNYTIPVLVILIVFAAFQVHSYLDRLGYVFFAFMLYGWAVLPFVYLLQYMFSKPATGMILISLLNILSGLVFMMIVVILRSLDVDAWEVAEWFFLVLFPNYNLGSSIMNMQTIAVYCNVRVCRYGDCCPDVLEMKWPGIGRECLFMFIQGIVYMLLVLAIELGLFQRIFTAGVQKAAQYLQQSDTVQADSDVSAEIDRINNTPLQTLIQSESLILKNVSKVYNTGFQAVKNVSCGIQANECFGLLGQNGAGKSTTFKMLTGEEIITSGDAFLNNMSLKSDLKQVHRNIGYCPQFDALIDQMTGRETLYMYARLRGIKQSNIRSVVNQLVDVLMLNDHIDKQTVKYSGGTKRKLSTAVSLIGDPPFIFLDEPTTGLDPAARRQLWNVIAGVRASGRTVVLISHSMEECDALCTKLVIMVNGNFVCLGSPQHLKNKFGHGYTLFCRMGLDDSGNTASIQPLAEFVNNRFQGATVFDDNTGYVSFKIADDNASLGQIFGVMETLKKQYNVEDYSVHQTSLEQIFLTFIKNQIPPAEGKASCCARCGCICFSICC